MDDHAGKVALVTGSSRGVGAETVRGLVRQGISAVVNYRDKATRANALADELRTGGGTVLTVQADVTDPASVARLHDELVEEFGGLDFLILNASGGMERDADETYAMRLNRDAQVALVETLLPALRPGGRVVFVTSHQAHFYGQRAVPNAYRPVAESKQAGELALRERIPALEAAGIKLTVVSGDLIADTITVKMLERAQPGTVAAREAGAGRVLTVREFADAVVAAALDPSAPSGETIFVGGADYLHQPEG